jgi:hypothetical protein
VALEGEQGVVAAHALAVVGYANQLAAAAFDLHLDARGAGVQGILQQLLYYGGRTVNHLARSDLIGDLVRKNADAAHKKQG